MRKLTKAERQKEIMRTKKRYIAYRAKHDWSGVPLQYLKRLMVRNGCKLEKHPYADPARRWTVDMDRASMFNVKGQSTSRGAMTEALEKLGLTPWEVYK